MQHHGGNNFSDRSVNNIPKSIKPSVLHSNPETQYNNSLTQPSPTTTKTDATRKRTNSNKMANLHAKKFHHC